MTPPRDLRRTVWKLDHGHELDEDERRFVAELARAQIKKPAHAPRRGAAKRRQIALTALLYCPTQFEAGLAEAKRVHGASKDTVRRGIEDLKALPAEWEKFTVAGVTRWFIRPQDGEWEEVDEVTATALELPFFSGP